jgi:hypothetical protein
MLTRFDPFCELNCLTQCLASSDTAAMDAYRHVDEYSCTSTCRGWMPRRSG